MFKKIKSFIKKYLTIFAGVMAVIFFWLAEYALHYFIVSRDTSLGRWFVMDPMELHMRVLVTLILMGFGLFAHTLIVSRKTAEIEASKNQILYRSLFSSMLNGFALHQIIVDDNGRPVDYEFLEINDAFERMTGLLRKDVIGRPSSAVMPDLKNDQFDWIGTYGRVTLNNEQMQFEQYFKPLDKWYNITAYSPSMGQFATVLEDITERKKIERVVRENQERMDTIFKSIQSGIMVIDRETHRIAYVNPSAAKMIGAEPEQLLDHSCQKYVCPADIDACPITDQGQKVDNSERILLTVDGRQLPILKTVVEAELEGRRVLVESFVDISERKMAEQALQLSENNFREILNSLDGLVYVADMKTYETLFVNKYGKDIWGDFTGKTCWQNLQSGQKGPCSFCTNDRLLRPDGTPAGVHVWEFQNTITGKWYECRDSAIRWPDGRRVRMEIATDITQRKLYEKEIEKATSEIKLLLDSVGEGIYGLDDRGETIFINSAGAQLLGYRPEEMLGKVQHELTHHTKSDGSSYRISDCPIHASVKDGNVHNVTGEVFWRKDGSSFPVEYISTPIKEEGKINGSVVVFRDVTERKQAEAIQGAIYKISEISSSADNLLELYTGIHMIIDELMNTANFYIAMYNEKKRMLEFPYFVDERDPSPVSRKFKNGLTEYVIKNKKSLLAPPIVQRKLAKNGDVEIVGTPSIDWMGVPLNIGKTTLGALVVQSYRQEVRFGAKELAILNFISDNIAAAILRKKSEDERKKLVTELQTSLDNIKTLKGMVPICSSCKKIRNDKGYWQQVEEYVSEHTEADFSHGICDECAHKLYPQYFKDKKNKTKGDEVG